MDDVPAPLQVLVAGAGVAAWELVLALNALAGKRVAITLIAPDSYFTYRQPGFGSKALARPPMQRVLLDSLASDLGARLVRDTVREVVPDRHEVTTASGATHRYDELVVAVGARPYAPFRDAVTVGGQDTGEALADLSSRLERRARPLGRLRRPERRLMDAAALRAGRHDGQAGLERRTRRSAVLARHSRAATTGGFRSAR